MAIGGGGQHSIQLRLVDGKLRENAVMLRHHRVLCDAEQAIAKLQAGETALLRLYGDNLTRVREALTNERAA